MWVSSHSIFPAGNVIRAYRVLDSCVQMADRADSPAVFEVETEDQPTAKRAKHSAPQLVVPASRSRALRSVLKIFVVRSDQNFAQPWQMRPQRSATGSAFVIDRAKRHILTNAHMVNFLAAILYALNLMPCVSPVCAWQVYKNENRRTCQHSQAS